MLASSKQPGAYIQCGVMIQRLDLIVSLTNYLAPLFGGLSLRVTSHF